MPSPRLQDAASPPEPERPSARPVVAATARARGLSPRHRLALRVVLGTMVALLVLRYAAKQDWRGALATAARARPLWLLAVAALHLPLVWTKARRTQRLLAPTVRVGLPALMRLFVTSYAADNLVMGQAGIAVRVAGVRRLGAPWSTATALQALEKALEAMGLALVALVVALAPVAAAWAAWARGALRGAVIVAALSTALVAALVGAGLARGRLGRFVAGLGDAARALRRPTVAVEVALLSLGAWLVELGFVVGTLRALDLPLSLGVSALVVVAISLAALVPGLPANVGPFEAATVLALGAGGIDRSTALGVALVYHLLHTLPVSLAGLPGLVAARLRPTESDPAADGTRSATLPQPEVADDADVARGD